jgi:UPF0176 protein
MICNISSYKFIDIPEALLIQIQSELKFTGKKNNIKGTILLSTEGINLSLAGVKENIEAFQSHLASYHFFSDLTYKYSYSNFIPFEKLVIKIKKEIITFKIDSINPVKKTAPYITPQCLKEWYLENKDMILLDTRNDFEVEMGTFQDAIDLNLKHFRDFPEAIKNLPETYKNKPVITFCTGGIRCEKAALLLLQNGFKEVYQLQGGILNYFEQYQNEFYNGHCFVFDDRVAVTSNLEPLAE